MNEIVKYNNYLNGLKFRNFTSTDLNFLMTICAKVRDKHTKEVIINFDELKELAEYDFSTANSRFVEELKRMNRKLIGIMCELDFAGGTIMFVLFPTFEINSDKKFLKVAVNSRFVFLLNALIRDFTRFELAEFISLDSKYSKNLYRLLKQYRTTGVFKITNIADFREKLDCPSKYTQKYFTDDVLKVAIKELQNKKIFKNLNCEPQKAKKRGAPVIGYIITFTPEKCENMKRDEEKIKTAPVKNIKKNPKIEEHKYDYASLEAAIINN